MKRTLVCGALLILFLGLGGCGRYQYHSHIGQPLLSNGGAIALNVAVPVALKNASHGTTGVEELLCQYGSVDVMGSRYDITESAINAAKDALRKKQITVADKADKWLELSVDRVACDKGWKFSAAVGLRVLTGSGVTREYEGADTFTTGYQTTAGFENAMLQCVERMLNDPEIVAYLEK